MSKFTDALDLISGIDEADKGTLSAIASKYPDLDKHFVPSKDFSESEKQRKSAESTRDAALGRAKSWDEWADQNFVITDPVNRTGKTKGHIETSRQLDSALARISVLETGNPGGPMEESDFAKALEYAKQHGGFATKEDRGSMVAKQEFKDQNTRTEQTQYGQYLVYTNTAHLPLRFHEELGKELGQHLDMKDFVSYIEQDPKNRMQDINKTYEDYVAPKKQQLELKRAQDQAPRS